VVKINELKLALGDAQAALQSEKQAHDVLLDQQSNAKAAYQKLLKEQAKGETVELEALAKADGAYQAFEGRISAQRKLILEAEKTVGAAAAAVETEQARLDAEDRELARQPSGRIKVGAPNSEKDPKRGYGDHKEFLLDVMQAGLTGRVPEKLKPLAAAGSDEQGVYSDIYGGFLQPIAFSPDIKSLQAEADPTVGKTNVVPMDAPVVKFNARVDKNHATSVSGGLRVYRHVETEDAPLSRMQFEQITLDVHELIGAVAATETVLTDSPRSFVALLSNGFKDEFGAVMLNEKLNGMGTGEFLGVANAACVITVPKSAGHPAGTVTKEDVDEMASRCWRYGQAIWLANHGLRPSLRALVQVVGTGGAPVPYFTMENGQEFLDGKPIFFTEFCKAPGVKGDIVLGNWGEYLEGTYQGMQQAESIHARFLANERLFKFWMRNDARPWWTSVLTPKNGPTLAPFVVLANR
jgi:HK97 family phage major capsid protein